MRVTDPTMGIFEEEAHFQKIVELNCISAFKFFTKIVRSYLLFHLFFAVLIIAESVGLWLTATHHTPKPSIALFIAAIVLTFFSYLVLLFYFQAKKPEQFAQLKNWYLAMCKKSLPEHLAPSVYHLSTANAAFRLASYLRERDYIFHTPFALFNRLLRKIAFRSQARDLIAMSEVLLAVTVGEQIHLIIRSPTDLETHASLAHTYLALARLYKKERGKEVSHLNDLPLETRQKCEKALFQAIEEFKILDNYAPEDPWIHAQLAACYHELGQAENEIAHYEKIVKMGASDPEILYRLGLLYFQQGHTASGLRIYESLSENAEERAAELIEHYSRPLYS